VDRGNGQNRNMFRFPAVGGDRIRTEAQLFPEVSTGPRSLLGVRAVSGSLFRCEAISGKYPLMKRRLPTGNAQFSPTASLILAGTCEDPVVSKPAIRKGILIFVRMTQAAACRHSESKIRCRQSSNNSTCTQPHAAYR